MNIFQTWDDLIKELNSVKEVKEAYNVVKCVDMLDISIGMSLTCLSLGCLSFGWIQKMHTLQKIW